MGLFFIAWIGGVGVLLLKKSLPMAGFLILTSILGILINSIVYYLFFDFYFNTGDLDYLFVIEIIAIIFFIYSIKQKLYIKIGTKAFRICFFVLLTIINIIIAYISYVYYGHYLK